MHAQRAPLLTLTMHPGEQGYVMGSSESASQHPFVNDGIARNPIFEGFPDICDLRDISENDNEQDIIFGSGPTNRSSLGSFLETWTPDDCSNDNRGFREIPEEVCYLT